MVSFEKPGPYIRCSTYPKFYNKSSDINHFRLVWFFPGNDIYKNSPADNISFLAEKLGSEICPDDLLIFKSESVSTYYVSVEQNSLIVISPYFFFPYLTIELPLIFILSHLAAAKDGIFLHGAGAVIDGGAFAILGVPEAGKSTSIAMIEHDFLLSDDMLVMRFQDNLPILHSTPLGPNTDGPGSAPLKAIFFPVKSDHFELRPLSRLRAIEQYYHAQAGYWDKVFKPYRKMHFEKVCRLFSQVKAYEMHFTRDYIDNNSIRQALHV